MVQTLPISLPLMLQYTIIRLSYVPIEPYSLLVSLFDLLTAVVVIWLYHTLMNSESEQRKLREKIGFLPFMIRLRDC